MSVRAQKPLKGWHVLAMLIAFFGVVVGANAAFIIAAVSSFPGEERQHAYAAGLRFNDTVNARRQQAALGWRADLKASRAAGVATLSLRFAGRDGLPIPGLKIEGELRRPVHSGDDRPVSFVGVGGGRYAATIPDAGAGLWSLKARAKGPAGETFDLETRVNLP